MKKYIFYIITVLGFLLFVIGSFEAYLRTFGHPLLRKSPDDYFKSIAGKDQTYEFAIKNSNVSYQKVDPIIFLKRTSIGLRGPELDLSKNQLRVVTMGGSTTECIVLSDGTTWPDIFNKLLGTKYWVGNAGVNGQSSWGHQEYLRNFIIDLKPKYTMFLMGANEANSFYLNSNGESVKDFGLDKKKDYNKNEIKEIKEKKLVKKLFNFLDKNHFNILTIKYLKSYLEQTLINAYKIGYANIETVHGLNGLKVSWEREIELTKLLHRDPDLEKIEQEIIDQTHILNQTRQHLLEIIKITKLNKIKPIFITQPALFGLENDIDPITKVNLGTMIIQEGNVGWGQGLTGKEMWILLEKYNDVIRDVAKKKKVPLIDLANLLEKNSNYYYDYIHYSKQGAKEVGTIVYEHFCKITKECN